MIYQYNRKWNLLVIGDDGEGLNLSPLRCTFNIEKKDTQTPNKATFTIYNVKDETIYKIRKSFVKIIVNAGYVDNFGLIFTGNIKGFYEGKEGTDGYIKIYAGDGDVEYNYSMISKTVAAGISPDDQSAVLADSMGLKIGFKSSLNQTQLPRGKVFYGRPQEYMRQVADSENCSWSIQDGQITILKKTELLPDTAVLLTPNTGLIGVPERTEDGIEGTCLLNPLLKIGAALKIDQTLIRDADIDYNSDNNKKEKKTLAQYNADGEYRIISITHSGDTRGNEWYSKFKCLSINQSAKDNNKVNPK